MWVYYYILTHKYLLMTPFRAPSWWRPHTDPSFDYENPFAWCVRRGSCSACSALYKIWTVRWRRPPRLCIYGWLLRIRRTQLLYVYREVGVRVWCVNFNFEECAMMTSRGENVLCVKRILWQQPKTHSAMVSFCSYIRRKYRAVSLFMLCVVVCYFCPGRKLVMYDVLHT